HALLGVIDDLIAVLATSPASQDRWELEVKLLSSRARAITLLRGFGSDAEDAYAEALALVKTHGEVPQWFPILRNLGSFHGLRGEFEKGMQYANEILRLAEAEDDVSMRVHGYAMLGADTGFSGRMDEALGYLDLAIEGFERSDYRPGRHRFGIDTRISCLTTSGFFLWLSRYPARAIQRAAPANAPRGHITH